MKPTNRMAALLEPKPRDVIATYNGNTILTPLRMLWPRGRAVNLLIGCCCGMLLMATVVRWKLPA